MPIKLKEGRTFKDPTDGLITTAVGKADAIIYREKKTAEIVVRIWRDQAAMENNSRPIKVDRFAVRGVWWDNYFNRDNSHTDNPADLTAHIAYLIVHNYYETRYEEDEEGVDVYKYDDWEPL